MKQKSQSFYGYTGTAYENKILNNSTFFLLIFKLIQVIQKVHSTSWGFFIAANKWMDFD